MTLLPLVSKVPPPAPSGASLEEMSVVLPAAHCRPPPLSVIMPEPKLLADREVDQAAGHRGAARVVVAGGEGEDASARLGDRARAAQRLGEGDVVAVGVEGGAGRAQHQPPRGEMSDVLPAAHCRPPPFKMIVPVPKLLSRVEVDQAAVDRRAAGVGVGGGQRQRAAALLDEAAAGSCCCRRGCRQRSSSSPCPPSGSCCRAGPSSRRRR